MEPKTNSQGKEQAGKPFGGSTCSEFPWQVIGWKARFKNAFGRWREYVVKGWTLDSNGCFRTHSAGVLESFFDQTIYFPNAFFTNPSPERTKDNEQP